MNRERAKELAPIIAAYGDGKEVQYQRDDGTWGNNDELGFNPHYEYRIKPEPQVVPYTDRQLLDLVGKPLLAKYAPYATVVSDAGGGKVRLGMGVVGRNSQELLDDYTHLDGSPCGRVVA